MANRDRLFFMAMELGGAGQWAGTTSIQMGRVLEAARDVDLESTPATTHRLHFETYFFLSATRQLLRMCEAYLAETKDQDLRDALDRFREAAPDAINFRDWAEHLDAYFAGEGNMQITGKVDRRANLAFERPGDRVVLHFDGRKLDLLDTHSAAQAVATAASDAWMEHVVRKAPPGTRAFRDER